MNSDIKELRDLPLADLISAPLNAVIIAQTNAALSTVAFIEQVGLNPKSEESKSMFDEPGSEDHKYDVRVAKLIINEETIEIPFVSLFHIPSFEISSLEWDFSVKLKSMMEFETSLTHGMETKTTGDTSADIGLQGLGIPIGIGTGAKVEATTKTDFEMRFGVGREQEYNLKINVKANAAPTPKGIERLLDVAERIAAKKDETKKDEPEDG